MKAASRFKVQNVKRERNRVDKKKSEEKKRRPA